MAISHVGSNTQDSAGATTLTFTVPAATTTDDLILVFVKQSENTGQQIWDDDGGGGNGYTRAQYNRTTSGRDQETAVYWKFATSGSEANPTFDWDSGGTAEPMSGIMEVYRGVDKIYFTSSYVTHTSGANDANPPNAQAATIDFDDSWVVVNHAATHDDITTVAAPTGYTLRSQIWNGTADDHRNNFSADISNIDVSADPYTPPDWGHTVANTTPEFHCYTVLLPEAQPIHITDPDPNDKFNWADTNTVITGDGFEATQGTGKVELWSDTSGTTKVTQTIDSWSDTSIQFDFVQSTLVDGINYLVVTNDTGDQSAKIPLAMGFGPYEPWSTTEADHYWTMNNKYDDEAARGGAKPCNQSQVGAPDFVTTTICRTNTHSLRLKDSDDKTEVADSAYTNISTTHTYRNIGGWIQLDALQEGVFAIYEEGGGVNNIYMIMMPNGRLAINVADSNGTPDFKCQAYSDFPLITNRAYHTMIDFQAGDHFSLWIDGVEQTLKANESSLSDTTMSTHSGDWSFGRPDGSLDTGGVDIQYDCANTLLLAHWGTWSGLGGGSPLTTAEIRDNLFRDGALAEHTISAGTESAMQTSMNAYNSQTHADEPLTFDIEGSTSGSFTLDITDQVWPDEVKFQVRYLGGDTLTIRNIGTSNFDTSKAYSPVAGTIAVINAVAVKITVKDIDTDAAVQNARVRIVADTGGPLTAGDVILTGLTDVNGELETTLDFTSNQPITGVVRKGSASTYYRESGVVGTITSAGFDNTTFLIKDE